MTEGAGGYGGGGQLTRSYRRSDDGFVAADGRRLPTADVEELRARVLASRPRPGESAYEILQSPDAYLASLGLTDEVIAERAPEIRKLCAGDWKDKDGRPLALRPELDELFELEPLKRAIVDYLLRAPEGSTRRCGMQITIPGDPWIELGTLSNSPDQIPWYVVAGDERWYLLDRELSRALVDLEPADGRMRTRIDNSSDWRNTIWSSADAWRELRARANATLVRVSYQLVPGWDAIAERFEPGEPSGRCTSLPALPSINLRVREAGTIDEAFLRPGSEDRDWDDVLAGFERAEELASAQPLLARWKEETGHGIAVFLPAGIDHFGDEASIHELWEEEVSGGPPEFALNFRFTATRMGHPWIGSNGSGVLSANGTLLILSSSGTHGPLGDLAPPASSFRDTGHYGLVLPGGDLEIRVREH